MKRFNGTALEGYVLPYDFQHREGVEILARTAEEVFVPYSDVRAVYFIRDFGDDPENNLPRLFGARPKRGGLWVRMRFRDGEELEGVMPNNLLIMGQYGVTLSPPDVRGNAQKVFIPSVAISKFEVLGVIRAPRRRARRPPAQPKKTRDLFSGAA